VSAHGHIIITGVSSGIGLAIARAALAKGYVVQGVGRRPPEGLEDHTNWTFTPCDLTDLPAVDKLVFHGGANTILVNNAGTLGPVAQSENVTAEEISACMLLNVTAPMRLTARFLKEVPGEKQVYFTGSGAAQHTISGWSAYCASKAAIHMYAEVVALEYPDVAIHVFKPGKVDTPMQAQIRNTKSEDFPSVPHFIEEYESGNLVDSNTVAERLLYVIEAQDKPSVVFPISQIKLIS
tara:strand:+ start:11032 stop:11742 length:711 start_codon:yes stop_codon:yes gene_type:complete